MSKCKQIFDLIEIAIDPAKQKPKPDLRSYTHIKAYHACRPRDVTPYLEQGIRFLARQELEDEFRRIFQHIPARHLDEAIAQYGPPSRTPDLYASLDERFLMEFCGQYALYGSETIKGFAANLPCIDKSNHFEPLKKVGTPTTFVLEIPIEHIAESFLDKVDELLEHLANDRHDEVYQTGTLLDCAVQLHKPIPPEWIVSYHTPKRIVNTEERSRVYTFD